MTPEQIAKVCYEANRGFCESIGDYTFVAWEEAPLWQKDTCINGVKFIIASPHSGPEVLHENWLKDKYNNGWKHGKTKDAIMKTHPCMVPYTMLSKEQQSKDYIFGAIVRALSD